jgi:hypothetical protein
MWQPSRAQWAIIWPIALLIVLAWPPDKGRSLGMKVVSWAVDPSGTLPVLPPPLPMGLDDDGDAVAEHDMLETAYFQARERSATTRYRMDVKNAGDPLESSTQRQLLVGIGVIAALLVWRMEGKRSTR